MQYSGLWIAVPTAGLFRRRNLPLRTQSPSPASEQGSPRESLVPPHSGKNRQPRPCLGAQGLILEASSSGLALPWAGDKHKQHTHTWQATGST